MQHTVVQDQAVPDAAASATAGPNPATPATAGPGTPGLDASGPGKRTRVVPDRTTRSGLGRYGERVAARHLVEAGLRILDRNWRCVEGELDIVALDGDTIAVCEVKTRSERGFQQPSEAIDQAKAARLRRLAERWMVERWPGHFARLAGLDHDAGPTDPHWPPAPPGGVRIDLVAVVNRARGAALVDHLRGAV
ncbi:YraN family protein [Streptomyces sp. NRRL S-350]|uniref:YraN family protein n=1 Tax=Streptomyces sp. NRRL S-350 TaxID=1463902 RepID=UPI00099DB1B1|nr:YraN family protein [Streptomyces sp. NRRL S-350]